MKWRDGINQIDLGIKSSPQTELLRYCCLLLKLNTASVLVHTLFYVRFVTILHSTSLKLQFAGFSVTVYTVGLLGFHSLAQETMMWEVGHPHNSCTLYSVIWLCGLQMEGLMKTVFVWTSGFQSQRVNLLLPIFHSITWGVHPKASYFSRTRPKTATSM